MRSKACSLVLAMLFATGFASTVRANEGDCSTEGATSPQGIPPTSTSSCSEALLETDPTGTEVTPPAASPPASSRSGVEVRPTLPNHAAYGPARRGPFRIHANVPQMDIVWDREIHHVHHHYVHAPPETDDKRRSVYDVPYLRYAKHPYADASSPYVLRGSVRSDEQLPGRPFAVQTSVDGGYEWGGGGRVGAQSRLALWRLGLDLSATTHYTRDGEQARAFYRGNANALVAPVLRPRLTLWVGAGVAYASPAPDAGRTRPDVGVNVTSAIDLFPASPLLISARGDVAFIDGTTLVAGRGTLGYAWRFLELYGGYQASRFRDVVLHGPVVGVRTWF